MLTRFVFFIFLVMSLFVYSQDCKQTGTVIFIRNTGFVKGVKARIYKNDSLIFSIKNRECSVLELLPGQYAFKCSFGNSLEGVKNSSISITVSKCGIYYIQFALQHGAGNAIPSSGYVLKMTQVTQAKTVKDLLSKRFVKKEVSSHLYSIFQK